MPLISVHRGNHAGARAVALRAGQAWLAALAARPRSYAAVPAAAARCDAMTDSTITLYSDCLSPFSFFAFTVIDRYVKVGLWPAELVLKPILLGGVMAATGNLPPGACVHAHTYA